MNLPPKRDRSKTNNKSGGIRRYYLASYPDLVRRDSSAILTPISSWPSFLFLTSRAGVTTYTTTTSNITITYLIALCLDEARRKTKGEQYVANTD